MTKTLSRTLAIALLMGAAAPALALTTSVGTTVVGQARVGGLGAQVNANASASTTVSGGSGSAVDKAKARAAQELDRRITSLNAFLTRINSMQKVDANFKATLSAEIQSQITDLTNLKATIAGDTNIATLKPEIQSITKSYRIYALVLPQAAIGAAADRVQTLAGMFTTLGGKLASRIASSTGDTSAAVAAMADFNAKVADAQVQATAAVSHLSNLKPDNGDKTIQATNKTELTKARADIRVAMQDFVAARKDADTIVKALGGVSASANASASAGTTTQ